MRSLQRKHLSFSYRNNVCMYVPIRLHRFFVNSKQYLENYFPFVVREKIKVFIQTNVNFFFSFSFIRNFCIKLFRLLFPRDTRKSLKSFVVIFEIKPREVKSRCINEINFRGIYTYVLLLLLHAYTMSSSSREDEKKVENNEQLFP